MSRAGTRTNAKAHALAALLLLPAGLHAPRFINASATTARTPSTVSASAPSPAAQRRAESAADRRRQRCIDAAAARARARVQAGRERADRTYQSEIVACYGPGAGGAALAFAGASNVDYYRLAQMLASRRLSAAEYVARVRDRTRKVRLALRDQARLRALLRGDADGDLVPDRNDRCPDTEDLAPTDGRGCPPREEPQQPPDGHRPAAVSTDDVLAILGKMGLAATPACAEAPVPTVSEPLRAGVDPADRNAFLIAVTQVTNQPAGCPHFYEVDFRLSTPAGNLPPVIYSETVFREADAAPQPGPPRSILLRRSLLDPARNQGDELGLILHFFDVYDVREWRVRVVGGGGLTSGWSPWRRETQVRF